MTTYTLRPCRNVGADDVEVCEACEAEFFTIYRRNDDGAESAVIDFEFEDSVEMVCQFVNATKELQRLNNAQGE